MIDQGTRMLDESVLANDERWMQRALALASGAGRSGEVPVGAVLVRNGELLGEGQNQPIAQQDPTAHAEILAIRQGTRESGNYRLAPGCTLYVTLEPCPMCAGALVHARLERLVFGGRDLRFGGVRSKFRIADSDLLNHQVEVVEGVLASECLALLKNFFAVRR